MWFWTINISFKVISPEIMKLTNKEDHLRKKLSDVQAQILL